MSRINCNNINLIYGNHDSALKKGNLYKTLFATHQSYKSFKYKDNRIVLFHYPIISWNGISKGAIQLYGHRHGNLPDTGRIKMDVGVDTNNYYPYSLDEIIKRMIKRNVKTAGDHHD